MRILNVKIGRPTLSKRGKGMRFVHTTMLGFFFFVSLPHPAGAAEIDIVNSPVPVVLQDRLTVKTASGVGDVPIRVSRNWNFEQPDITRAVIIIHGWPRRDIDADEDLQQRAGSLASGTLFVTPQFLTEIDVEAHHLSPMTLRWGERDWLQGYDARSPAPISAFSVIDQIFTRLADRRRFPHLRDIVLAGHSAGGQFVQRYAAVGHAAQEIVASPIHVRYVVANPAAYLYFDNKRPQADGSFADVSAHCPTAGTWNNGLSAKLPAYVKQPVEPAMLEKEYLQRDVVYLLGTADNDPNADAIGQSCTYKTQGATRLERGHVYFRYVAVAAEAAHLPQLHRLYEVPGVAHRTFSMYHSACGLAAVFDKSGCEDARH
ncbi:pimeloyl-ACP methyl ester carboxylesterase [Herbaspirillum sp. Sphag1AN]|uniref:alpha/beta hydrolase n=1 Tax=unclassified Herbaspirillum TaxID=2624150 RepID=UPI001614E4C8|nr:MULTISPECIES: alpha/beta hydrolase [unclassified Herbaspirillum]MBB3213255.1 pimeloyl-ACP methyl ester carboxylesterase [Herbaspirillum sp. Sphag1AN]MBB3246452.1 pimeloyl-ACP methyl ester carboxylesterase [Herbaspirillum sp. Sphag64]